MASSLVCVNRAIHFQYPERVPIMHSILPSAWYRYGEHLFDIIQRYFPRVNESDEHMAYLISTASRYDYDPRLARYAFEDDFVFIQPRHFMEGSIHGNGHRGDEWGCMWHKAEPGISGVVIESPLAEWQKVINPSCYLTR